MKKTKIVSLALFIGVIFLVIGCVGTAAINDEYIVQPDPNNPFQGTWITSIGPGDYMHVIEGMKGTSYERGAAIFNRTWKKTGVYTIEKKGDEYVTNDNYRIRVDGDFLTIVFPLQSVMYKRFLGK